MKGKLKGVLGVALTLVMVLSLTVALAPIASADPDENEWSKYTTPIQGSNGDWVLVNYTGTPNIGPIVQAIDGSLYCYAYDTGDSDRLYKSEDGGYTWDDIGGGDTTGHEMVDIACSATDADVLYYATADSVYKTDDAGANFEKVADSPGAVGTGGMAITSLDVTYYEGDYMMVVGLVDTGAYEYGGVYLLDEGGRPYAGWIDQEVGNVPAGDGSSGGVYDVWDVAFSPNFEDDEQVLAVVVSPSAELGTSGGASTATWSTTRKHSGSYSAKLDFVDAHNYVDITPATGTTGDDFADAAAADFGFWYYQEEEADFGPQLELKFTDPGSTDFVDITFMLQTNTILDTWTEVDIGDTFGAIGGWDGTTFTSYADLAAAQTAMDGSDFELTNVRVELYDDPAPARTCYIDDVTIDGVTYDLEPGETFVTTKLGVSGWNTTVDDIELLKDDLPANHIMADGKAWLCFPDDYDSDPDEGYYSLFVGVHCTADADGDVYLVLGDGEVSIDLDASADNITCLDCAGPADEAYLMAGTDAATPTTGEDRVVRSLDAGGDWKVCHKEPTGETTNVYVVVSDDVADTDQAWAAVGGADGGVSLQVADRIWNTLGLIDYNIDSISDLSVSGDTVFMTTSDGTQECIWRAASGWERIFSETLEDAGTLEPTMVEVSPEFSVDETVFFAEEDTNEKIFYSNDGGNRFKAQIRAIPDLDDIEGWVIIEEDTLIVGTDAGSYKSTNNGRSWSTLKTMTGGGAAEYFALAPGFAVEGAEDEDHILAGCSNGLVFRSTTAGKKWSELEDSNMTGSVIPAFDADYAENSTMYCTDSDGGVFRYIKGESTEWARIDYGAGAPDPGFEVDSGTGLVVSADSTLYATDSTIGGEVAEVSAVDGDEFTITQPDTTLDTDNGIITVTTGRVQVTPTGSATIGGGTVAVEITPGGSAAWVTTVALDTLEVVALVDNTNGTWTRTSGEAVASLTYDADDPDDAWVVAAGGAFSLPDGEVSGAAAVSGEEGEGVSRCLNPDASITPDWDVYFEQVHDTVEGPLTKVLTGLWLTPGSNVLWSIFDGKKIYTLEDTLTGSVTLSSPANKKSSMRTTSVTFTWEALEGAKRYTVQVNTQENFRGAYVLKDDTKDTTYTLDEISAAYTGIPLYWRVRVMEQKPYRSNWSDKWFFSTQLTEAQWNPFVGGVPEAPDNGATDVPLLPTFAWNAADWATGYDWEIALDAGFTQPGWSMTGKNALKTTVYLSEHELEYSTTYYWRVRAISATSQSEWASAVFTTMAKPVKAPPPITVGPPAAPPAPIVLPTPIPAFLLWTIVGVGAALMIAVIVLIARTRRVT